MNNENEFYVREIQTVELEVEYTKEFNLVKILIDNFIDVTIYKYGDYIIFRIKKGFFRLLKVTNNANKQQQQLTFIEFTKTTLLMNSVIIYANGEFKNNYTYKRKKSFWEWLWGNNYG